MLHFTLNEHDRGLIEKRKREYWAQSGIGEEYHALAVSNDPLVRAKNLIELSLLHRSLSGTRVLDAGAGTGRFALPLRKSGIQVTAWDISGEMLAMAKKQGEKAGIRLPFGRADLARLPFPEYTFDTVYAITVLRHFPSWKDMARECMRVVRPGGRFIFDLASGEQVAYRQATGRPELSIVEEVRAAENFQAAALVQDIAEFIEDAGWSLVSVQPHDLISDNRLLKHFLGADAEPVMEALADSLRAPEALALYEWAARTVVPLLNPVLAPSLWIVAERRPSAGPVIRNRFPVGASGEDAIRAAVAEAGEDVPDAYRRYLAAPPARLLDETVRDRVLPAIPASLFGWRPGDAT